MLIRSVLVAFCIGLWFSILYTLLVVLLVLAWLLDDGHRRLWSLLKEPLVQAIGIFCFFLLLGLFWAETFAEGRHKWTKYLLLLTYIPFLGLLNRQRLPWAMGAAGMGFCLVLFAGLHAWLVEQQQGIPLFNMTYLTFSALLGIGSVFLCCCACMSRNRIIQILFFSLALVLLFLQFQQSARSFLLATLVTQMTVLVIYFRVSLRAVAQIAGLLVLVAIVFAYTSPVISERWAQARLDFENIRQDYYDNSIGYRLALWDVGLQGIAEKPFFGHGTGAPEQYFDQTVVYYKNGIYANLPIFQQTSHYHNDWIEIGMHLGMMGIASFMYLLWAWYRTLEQNRMSLPAIAMVSFVFFSGLTETFLIFARMPVLLLVITAIAVSWQKSRL
ncbi:MAG: O-antigen ligase family protein [Nitrosomonas sp.]|nr:O-antigen ligase family protein [Nitrosomonas sp.]